MDPYDDLPHTRAAQAGHQPEHGRITVHPTPGTDSLTCLAYDILAALDKPVPLTCYPRRDTQAPWATAAAWILAAGITHLTVLRAHLLTTTRLNTLLSLRARTGLRLTLVCHQRSVPTALEHALHTIPHRPADATAVLPDPQPTIPHPASPTTPSRPPANRWLNLPALTTLLADDAADRRCHCAAPTAQQRGFHPPALPAPTATEIAHRLRTATTHPHLAAALATACFTAASTTQLATAHVADLTPDAATITLHDRNGLRQGCMTHPVPPWARPLLLAAVYLQRLTGTGGPLLTADPCQGTGQPHLIAFAETCKLRPPQPARPRHRGTRSQQPVPKTIWPLSSAHYHFPWTMTEEMDGCPPPPSH